MIFLYILNVIIVLLLAYIVYLIKIDNSIVEKINLITRLKKDSTLLMEQIKKVSSQYIEQLEDTIVEADEKRMTLEQTIAKNKKITKNDENIKNKEVKHASEIKNYVMNNNDGIIDDIKKHEKINSKKNKIIQLQQKGLTVEQIARKLNTGIGEVQLFLEAK